MAPGGYSQNEYAVPGNTIVRHYVDYDAPTGDGGRVVTADGTHWEVVDRLPPRGTGDRQGYIYGGRVNEI